MGLPQTLLGREELGWGRRPPWLISLRRTLFQRLGAAKRVKTLKYLLKGRVQVRPGQNLSRSRLRCKVSKNPVNTGQNLAERFDGSPHDLLHAQSRQTSPISADPNTAAPGAASRTSAGSSRNAPRGETTKVCDTVWSCGRLATMVLPGMGT